MTTTLDKYAIRPCFEIEDADGEKRIESFATLADAVTNRDLASLSATVTSEIFFGLYRNNPDGTQDWISDHADAFKARCAMGRL